MTYSDMIKYIGYRVDKLMGIILIKIVIGMKCNKNTNWGQSSKVITIKIKGNQSKLEELCWSVLTSKALENDITIIRWSNHEGQKRESKMKTERR